MHEMSIANQLVQQVLQVAEANNAIRVPKVVIEVGTMQLVVPEAMQAAFTACVEGTCAEGAELELIEIEALAHCRNCENEFTPEIANYMCPKCTQANVEIVQGRDIILASLECDTEDEETA